MSVENVPVFDEGTEDWASYSERLSSFLQGK